MPLVSFVMPAYNAASHIRDAVGSILAQSFTDWELIICDDASTDTTPDIIREYAQAYPTIKFIRRQTNSGAALVPRCTAIEHATGKWIAPIDADDEIEPTYLQQLLDKAVRENADIVYPTMWRNHEYQLVPAPDFDYRPRAGRDAVELTLAGWRIGTNGGIILRSLYNLLDYRTYPHNDKIYTDETYDREVMFHSARTAFSHAKYFYRENISSVTKTVTPRKFDFVYADDVMLDFVRKNYTPGEPTRLAAEAHRFVRAIDAIRLFARHSFDRREDRNRIWNLIQKIVADIDFDAVRGRVGRKQYPLLKYFGARSVLLYYRLCKK